MAGSNVESPPAEGPLACGDHLLGRYRVIDRIAVGGHSVVYRGEDERLARPVCVKVFHKVRTDAGVWRTSYEHFVQEAFALSRLNHPNTLRIYDFGHLEAGPGDDGGPPFQISEYMGGGTVAGVIASSGPLPASEVAPIVRALCGALGEAHQFGIVHRDIKPQNILFAAAGHSRTPKLADFGIAKTLPLEGEGVRNRAGDTAVVAGHRLVMYSASWAAPEQRTGARVTPAADIYSLALVTIYMLTGHRVFDPRQLAGRALDRERIETALRAVLDRHEIPPQAAGVLAEACAFDPAERPSRVEDFGRSLEAALADEEPVTVPFNRPSVEVVGIGASATSATPEPPLPAPPVRAGPQDGPITVARRRVRFVPLRGGCTDLEVAGERLRITVLPVTSGAIPVHLKGLTCFVGYEDKPASPAVNLRPESTVHLVTPNRRVVARADVRFGRPAAGHTLLKLERETVAVSHDDCPFVFALDFGPDADCIFVHTPGAMPSDARRRRGGRK